MILIVDCHTRWSAQLYGHGARAPTAILMQQLSFTCENGDTVTCFISDEHQIKTTHAEACWTGEHSCSKVKERLSISVILLNTVEFAVADVKHPFCVHT